MSYSMGYPVVAANAQAEARAAFVRRTYAHLAGAILAFIALETVLLNVVSQDNVITLLGGGSTVGLLVVFGAFIGGSFLAQVWARSNNPPALQYLGLGLYVVLQAVIFLPILYVATYLLN